MRKTLLFALALMCGTAIFAQQVRPAASGDIYRRLCQLNNLTNVLYVAAHPDDENTRLLAWLANTQHIRTAYLSLTRGDGGQNILGSEQSQALGLIRTHELMEARNIDGAEQFFTSAIDFGFSKTSDETFKHWDENQLTADVVSVMRQYRPDVVICRFPPNAMAGHGQHAASAILAAKAYKAVGDKTQYTDIPYPAWQPKRLLFNAYRFGDRSTITAGQFIQPVGDYLPFLGMGTGELAGISRSIHRSQGAGTPSVPGIQKEYFQLIGGDTLTQSLFDGIDITWGRVGRKDIGDDIKKIIDSYDQQHPDASIPALLAVRKKIVVVKDEYWRKQKLQEIDALILSCSGFLAELYAKQPVAVAGAQLPFVLHTIARSATPVILKSINWINETESPNIIISKDSLIEYNRTVTIPANIPVTQPYWLVANNEQAGSYTISNRSLLGLPETPNNLNISLQLQIGDATFTVPVPLSYKKLDPTRGDVVEQLRIVPAVVLDFATNVAIINTPSRPLQVQAEATSGAKARLMNSNRSTIVTPFNAENNSVQLSVHITPYQNISGATLAVTNGQKTITTVSNLDLQANNDTNINITLTAEQLGNGNNGSYILTANITANGKTYDKAQHIIQYTHIPTLQYFTTPTVKVLRGDWQVTARRIGYIDGAGDYAPTLLRLAGLQVDILKADDMVNADNLKKYDAILTGIRAVNVEKHMAGWMPVLLQYVHNGGTLVMQYNTLQDLSTTHMGPYPFTLANKRVTEEDAAVTLLQPGHRLLTHPNKISQDDFKDWVQERGLYFAGQWDKNYLPLFRMNDTGEDPLDGCTLYTTYGKGHYVYTTLSFSRQLPAGNTGAIRLLMNMLSAGK